MADMFRHTLSTFPGSALDVVKRCELCMGALTLDSDTFDLNDYYRRHRNEQQVN